MGQPTLAMVLLSYAIVICIWPINVCMYDVRTWGTWSGPADDKYSEMKYEHGQNCWNGPDRTAMVTSH